MHAVLITYRSETMLTDLEGPFARYALALCRVPGLIAKTWLKDGETLGGFHVFASRSAADAFLGGDLVAGLMAMEGFGDFVIEHYGVVDGLSRVTGTPVRPLAAAG